MKRLLIVVLMFLAACAPPGYPLTPLPSNQASPGEYEISTYHDAYHGVTCWLAPAVGGIGISCIPDQYISNPGK